MQIYKLFRNYTQKSFIFSKVFSDSFILQGFQAQSFLQIINYRSNFVQLSVNVSGFTLILLQNSHIFTLIL
jgi:hypothetical protein